MGNIVYNNFAKAYSFEHLDLTAANTYKIALFRDTEIFTPAVDDYRNFYSLQLAGVECSDTTTLGYMAGGTFIKFELLADEGLSDGLIRYTCNTVEWKNATLVDENAIKYAVIYRERDGLLVSCYSFETVKTADNEAIIIDWQGMSTITIDSNYSSGGIIVVDDHFSNESTNPLQNKLVSKAFGSFGIATSEAEKELAPDAFKENIEVITKIDTDYIDNIFGNKE